MALGVLINFSLLLLLQKLSTSLAIGAVLALAGWIRFGRSLRSESPFERPGVPAILSCIYVVILFYFNALGEGIAAWDPRSVWFFHSKMIWLNGGIDSGAGWNDPSIQWSHVDYPNLIPALGAQMAWVMGYWNEFIPKGGLFLALLPALFLIFSFFRFRFSFLFLFLCAFFSLNPYLLSGYMDGPLALYALVGALLLGRFAESKKQRDAYTVVSLFGIMLGLKNEGVLLALCLLVCFRISHTFLKSSAFKRILALSLLPALIWFMDKKFWSIHGELFDGDLSARLLERALSADALGMIFKSMLLGPALIAIGFLVLAFALTRIFAVEFPRFVLGMGLACFLYEAGLFGAYLVTPYELSWHLQTSADRISLVGESLIFAMSYLFLERIDSRKSVNPS